VTAPPAYGAELPYKMEFPTQYCDSNRPANFKPFFSICIPQYNRTDFLVKACQSFAEQDFKNFELCISDDCSDDMKEAVLLEYVKNSGLIYVYAKTAHNLRFDGNLRNAIALSVGEYLLLMGNDDGLSDTTTLRALRTELMRFGPADVVVTNYRDLSCGRVYRRVPKTGVVGHGPATAALTFRNYSFLSGIILKGDPARQAATCALDGSEMYQMYLGTRLVAEGGRLLGIDRVCVDKDLKIPNQVVDSYRLKPRLHPCPIVERPLPLGRLLQVVAAGLRGGDAALCPENYLINIARQLYVFTYPFWIFEYRLVQSWRYALGVYLALRPSRITTGLKLSVSGRVRLWMMYGAFGLLSLTIPIGVFQAARPSLYAFAKRLRIRDG
jgi:hypothetical protein